MQLGLGQSDSMRGHRNFCCRGVSIRTQHGGIGEWMDEVSVQTTPNALQQKAHLQGGSQSYRHGWRRSSFNSSWFEREARQVICLGNQPKCLAVSHLTSQIHHCVPHVNPPCHSLSSRFIGLMVLLLCHTQTNLDLYALHLILH